MLYFVATPIGNLDDLSLRAVRVLREAEVIACEDTRRTWALLSHVGIPRPRWMISYREQTEERETPRLLALAREGRSVAVCTDAGFPGISDPGYRLASAAAEQGIPITVIPGASAVDVALLASGLPTSSFTFKGYPPRRAGSLQEFFAMDRDAPHTLVLFESPQRVGRTLKAACDVLGDRRAAVCIELTKKFERVERDFLSELAGRWETEKVRGEVTLVIAGCHPKFRRDRPGTPFQAEEAHGRTPARSEPGRPSDGR